METVTTTTTDVQMAVRVARHYYADGAPPDLCVRLVSVCEYLHRLPQGGWPETQQGWRQARETWDRLTETLVAVIVRDLKHLRGLRADAQRTATLARASEIAKPHAKLVERIVSESKRLREHADHDEFFVDVITSARPDLTREQAVAISTVCRTQFAQ